MAAMAAILESILHFFSWTERPIYSKLDRKYLGDLLIKIATISVQRAKMVALAAMLRLYFELFI